MHGVVYSEVLEPVSRRSGFLAGLLGEGVVWQGYAGYMHKHLKHTEIGAVAFCFCRRLSLHLGRLMLGQTLLHESATGFHQFNSPSSLNIGGA